MPWPEQPNCSLHSPLCASGKMRTLAATMLPDGCLIPRMAARARRPKQQNGPEPSIYFDRYQFTQCFEGIYRQVKSNLQQCKRRPTTQSTSSVPTLMVWSISRSFDLVIMPWALCLWSYSVLLLCRGPRQPPATSSVATTERRWRMIRDRARDYPTSSG